LDNKVFDIIDSRYNHEVNIRYVLAFSIYKIHLMQYVQSSVRKTLQIRLQLLPSTPFSKSLSINSPAIHGSRLRYRQQR